MIRAAGPLAISRMKFVFIGMTENYVSGTESPVIPIFYLRLILCSAGRIIAFKPVPERDGQASDESDPLIEDIAVIKAFIC